MSTNPNDPINPAKETPRASGLSGYASTPGLTKREHLAAMAMQGYIAAGSTWMPDRNFLAKYAVAAADALIEALNKEAKS